MTRVDGMQKVGRAGRAKLGACGPLAYGKATAMAMTDDDLKDLAVELVLKYAEQDSPIDAMLTERIRDRLNEIEDDTQVAKLISYIAAYAGVFLDHLASANGVPPREILRRMKS